ncbi:MAG: hypothetical protein KKC79_05815 [Gammaproteobacteria bacterium]|nr:hypothetical protein [Gammaproteobacteria bacterium]MBU2408152.1 hypothetical protein [Gammaproteobacteria bacterium]
MSSIAENEFYTAGLCTYEQALVLVEAQAKPLGSEWVVVASGPTLAFLIFLPAAIRRTKLEKEPAE